ncbi:MAG: carboxypeptidase-like regulatory domain-containing protein [Bacteroidales bacterium]|nr:carboxypeptidase-like regulatory domain-containing protein [Bacteroidales bacterium]
MFLRIIAILLTVISVNMAEAGGPRIVVADSLSHVPLPGASIYDKNDKAIAVSNNKGQLPLISSASYPITVRYLGFKDKILNSEVSDTIFLQEFYSELPEVTVSSRGHRLMHILAFVREYSSLSTYTDTVFLFREKMVDFMIKTNKGTKFREWVIPRTLTSRSYYRFTNAHGLDSVSDSYVNHFSWSDWVGLPPNSLVPEKLRSGKNTTDTIRGKYSPTEIWNKDGDNLNVIVNVLADTAKRVWVPNLAVFFKKYVDFEQLRINFDYNNAGDSLRILDLGKYSYQIESRGRARDMFRFNRLNEPCFVSTFADVYILDREFITLKEAKKWESSKFDISEVGIYEPMNSPDLPSEIITLIDRVNSINTDKVRLDYIPDHRYISKYSGRNNFKIGNRALILLKQMTGISSVKAHRSMKNSWKSFLNEQKSKNRGNLEK